MIGGAPIGRGIRARGRDPAATEPLTARASALGRWESRYRAMPRLHMGSHRAQAYNAATRGEAIARSLVDLRGC